VRFLSLAALAVILGLGASGAASSSSLAQPVHRGCPPKDTKPVDFEPAYAQAERFLYGTRVNIQGRWYVYNARNTKLVDATGLTNAWLLPGMPELYRKMHQRCSKRTPDAAWAFSFHVPTIAPDYSPTFVARTSDGWSIF
jgi:hypothetical protein